MFTVVVKRVRGVEQVVAETPDLLTAYALRNQEAARLMARGFTGATNGAGVWRLSKRVAGRRVRLAVFIAGRTFSLN